MTRSKKYKHYDMLGRELKAGQTALRVFVVSGHIEHEIVGIEKINNQSVRISWIRDGKKGRSNLYKVKYLIIFGQDKSVSLEKRKAKNRFEMMDLR